MVRAQCSSAERLRSEVDSLREEAGVLRKCLVDAGILEANSFLVRLHQSRFKRMLRAHPLCQAATFIEIIGTRELILNVSWRAGPHAARALCAASKATAVAGLASLTAIYVCGGQLSTAAHQSHESMETHNLETGTWEVLSSGRPHCDAAAAAGLAGRLYVVGSRREASRAVRCFCPKSRKWESSAPMATARKECAAATCAGELHVVGGIGRDGDVLSSSESFDPRTGNWVLRPPMAVGRSDPAVASVAGRLYALGGACLEDNFFFRHLNSVEWLDPIDRIWQTARPMVAARLGAAAAAVGGWLYVFGGLGEEGKALASAERLDPEANLWEPLPRMATPRAFPAAVAAAGRVYALGGGVGRHCSKALRSAEDTPSGGGPRWRRWQWRAPGRSWPACD